MVKGEMRSGKRAYMTGTTAYNPERPTGANDDAHPNNSESQLQQLIARGEPQSCFTLIIPAPRDRTVLAWRES